MEWEDAYELVARIPNRAVDWVETEGGWLVLHFDHPDTSDPMQLAVQLDGSGRRVLVDATTHEELYEF